ncbi:MAG: hypothetical protein NC040_03825 [Muribaculaceae bacterium]|nr:hypothetical protein [Alistipes senegalensis]MCM1473160.1 hypothetical protein [Muribaculaceae bacterium]
MNKNQDEIKSHNPKPVKKLKPLKPVSTSGTAIDNKEKPVKKEDKKKSDKKKTEKKGFFESMKDIMYASADDDAEKENNENNFTVEALEEDSTANTLETISEVLAEINDELPKNKPEEELKEKTPEQVKEPEKKNNNNNRKKNKKSQQKNNSVENKKSQEIPAETETTEVQNTVETPEKVKTATVPVHSVKYNILALICIILAIIGVIAIINACISGGSSSDDKYRKAVYPAVITDINAFENPSELPVNQILSTAIWSVIIDSEKLSAYPQRVNDMAIIPAEDIEKYAAEIFGEDIPALTHSTIVTSDSKFYYNEEANSYSVEISPHTFTYTPEVISVSGKSGKYIVEVNYIDHHPEWIEETVSKTVEYSLSKNSNGGYTIESMHETTAE